MYDDRFYSMRNKVDDDIVGIDRHESMIGISEQPAPQEPLYFIANEVSTINYADITPSVNGVGGIVLYFKQDLSYVAYEISTGITKTGVCDVALSTTSCSGAGYGARIYNVSGSTTDKRLYNFKTNTFTPITSPNAWGNYVGGDSNYRYFQNRYVFDVNSGTVSRFNNSYSTLGGAYTFKGGVLFYRVNSSSNSWISTSGGYKMNGGFWYNATIDDFEMITFLTNRSVSVPTPAPVPTFEEMPDGSPHLSYMSYSNATTFYGEYVSNGIFQDRVFDYLWVKNFVKIDNTQYYIGYDGIYVWNGNSFSMLFADSDCSPTGNFSIYFKVDSTRYIVFQKNNTLNGHNFILFDPTNSVFERFGSDGSNPSAFAVAGHTNNKIFYRFKLRGSSSYTYEYAEITANSVITTRVSSGWLYDLCRAYYVTGYNDLILGSYNGSVFARFYNDGTRQTIFSTSENFDTEILSANNYYANNFFEKALTSYIENGTIYIIFCAYQYTYGSPSYGTVAQKFDQIVAVDISTGNWWLVNNKKRWH